MSEPYHPLNAYSGPVLLDTKIEIIDQSVDVFGQSTVILPESPLFPAKRRIRPFFLNFEMPASVSDWIQLTEEAPAGVYRWTYRSGAVNPFRDGLEPSDTTLIGQTWNLGYLPPFSGGKPENGPTNRPWLRSANRDRDTIWMPAPAFTKPGYWSAEVAAIAALNTSVEFVHPGGSIDAIWDLDPRTGPAQGSVEFELERLALPEGNGFWKVEWSSNHTLPTIQDPFGDKGVVEGLEPGLHLVRYYGTNRRYEYRWQEFWIWVWETTPRRAPGARLEPLSEDRRLETRFRMAGGASRPELERPLFPVRPPKAFVTDGPLINRLYLEQERKTSGNRSEVPQTEGFFDERPERRGDGEAF